MVVVTIDSFIRHLPHRAFVKLSSYLDPQGLWEKMAAAIPMRLEEIDDENAEKRYSHQQVAVFALMGLKMGPGSSPTQRVLMDWQTKNARIHHLIKVLMQTQFFAAADYLHHDILGLGPVPRPLPEDSPPANTDTGSAAVHSQDTKQPVMEILKEPCSPETLPELPEIISPEILIDSETLENHISYDSSHHKSEPNESAVALSQLQRQSSVTNEDMEGAWIGLQDIEIQDISYSMLGNVTKNFNDVPLDKGGRLIGSGGFGVVYLGEFHNGFKIAVKCLKQSEQMKQEDLIKQFENEVKTLSQYRHDNVVHLLGYSIDGPSQCLVYQYLPNGSLEDRLACYQGTPPLSANMRLKIVKGTASGIQYLNDNGHVHRDIKTANILLDSEYTAKVGDFATVVSAPSGEGKTVQAASVVIGTAAYLAPEAIHFDVSTKLDSYSFGVVLLEVITGLIAQDDSREERTLSSHIMENVEQPEEIHDFVDQSAGTWPDGVVDKLYDISMRCLTMSKKQRPNVKDVRPELEEL